MVDHETSGGGGPTVREEEIKFTGVVQGPCVLIRAEQ